MLLLLLLLALLSSLCLASPPTTSSTFSSTSLIIMNNILNSPTGLVNAARHGKLNDYLPSVCESTCSNYTRWEASCLMNSSHKECGLEFCARPMTLGYHSCINCLLYATDPSTFTPRKYVYLETQFTILQISCTAVGRSTGSPVQLASYDQIGANINNATDFQPPDVKVAAVAISSARAKWESSLRSRLGLTGIGLWVLGWNLL